LLILGEPGSGKTTLLLELTRSLLDRAEWDEALPMPVVFPLAPWAAKRLPLADWLVDELSQRYDVPRQIGHAWVANDRILPLLDGLDEVAERHRSACVGAINAYQEGRAHVLPGLVVTSRVADYDAVTARTRLRGAVLLQPLSPHPAGRCLPVQRRRPTGGRARSTSGCWHPAAASRVATVA
jgi:predicted NACHT family NTPase